MLTARTHEVEAERNQMAQEFEKQREAFEQHLSDSRERGKFVNTSNRLNGMVNREVDVESGDNMNVNDTVVKLEYDQLELNFSQLQVCNGNVYCIFWFLWLSVSLGAMLSADSCLDLHVFYTCSCLSVCLSFCMSV